MKKEELAAKIAAKSGLTKSQALNAIDSATEILTDAFSRDDDLFIRQFGTFKVCHRKPRAGRDIYKNIMVEIPSCRVVKFIMGKQLKETMNR